MMVGRAVGRLVFAVVSVATLAGCYHGSAKSVTPGEVGRKPGWVVVRDVHLVRQSAERDCGAAALAMVLGRWGIASSTDDILRAHPPAPGHGIPAVALRDFARERGLAAFLINGELGDLAHEVDLDRPVLVGLVQRYGQRAYPHYEVVVGVNKRARRVLTYDPGRDLREDGFDGFSAEWEPAGRLALVVAPR